MTPETAAAVRAAWRGLTDEDHAAMRAAAFAEQNPDRLAGTVLAAVAEADDELLRAAFARVVEEDGPGWVKLRSRALDAELVVVRHRRIPLPDRVRATPAYSLAELELIGETVHDAEALRAVHDYKAAFPGSRLVEDPPPAAPPPDVYGPDAPTVPCHVCGRAAWFRAGSAWACGICHPDPNAPRAPGA